MLPENPTLNALDQTSYAQAEATFLQAYPEFQTTRALDELRATEYARLDRLGQVYLDYTGGGLYADSQIRAHTDLLLNNVLGNPHSTNPTSLRATRCSSFSMPRRKNIASSLRRTPAAR